jgi:ubiquinone/menaquinone biosynthesis C-methylase UbiE
MSNKSSPLVTIWDEFWAGKDPASIYPPVTNIVRELRSCTSVHNKKILEVGAGTARDSIALSAQGADVFILDYSKESLRLARASVTDHQVTLLRADACYCPIKNSYFDIVFHQGLLEHFPSPYALLRENYRVLKKDGLLVVDVPQTFHLYTLIKNSLMLVNMWFAGWERQFTANSLGRLLRQTGFQPVHYYGDWSRPGIVYKIIREIIKKIGIIVPMYPRFLGPLTRRFYQLQERLRNKRLFLCTVLSIGIIARKI